MKLDIKGLFKDGLPESHEATTCLLIPLHLLFAPAGGCADRIGLPRRNTATQMGSVSRRAYKMAARRRTETTLLQKGSAEDVSGHIYPIPRVQSTYPSNSQSLNFFDKSIY
jgi:hypothetical protein